MSTLQGEGDHLAYYQVNMQTCPSHSGVSANQHLKAIHVCFLLSDVVNIAIYTTRAGDMSKNEYLCIFGWFAVYGIYLCIFYAFVFGLNK